MKKILSLVALMMMFVMGANAANKTISLVPGPWDIDGATFAAYAWKGEENAWFPFAEVGGAYVTQIPEDYTGIILARINPEGTDENPWNNVWNQTADIDFTTIADKTVFTITGWDKSDFTATSPVDALKAQLEKAIELADLFGIDTTAAKALLALPNATEAQLTAAMQAVMNNGVPKAQELIALAKQFFAKFDNVAGEALAPYIAAAETALAGTDFDAMYDAAMALFAQGLVEGQSALTKVITYLQKMEDETVNSDLAALTAAIASKDIKNILPALRQLKDDLPDAAKTYASTTVPSLIAEGQAAGKDVSGMQTALANALVAYSQYNSGNANVVDLGYALYQLIKAVEDYKAAASVVTIESLAIVGDFIGGEATEENPAPWWNPANGWAMTQDTENPAIWTLVKKFTAEAKTYEYKATANGNWTDYVLPEGDNATKTFEAAGKYILTFEANTEERTLTLNVEQIVPVEFPEGAIVYDFEAAAEAGENPANLNGSEAKGQAFYGWENAEKTDSKRQDYKGYEWAEGSVLPEACHVWRRSDRINGNMTEGGLKCPNNREMAVDGLKAGDKVIIVYDAEGATDKELIWAIGDGTSGNDGVVRATATIDGAALVTGESTIASGAEILVNSVTPAANGTGYIVFKVMKGMIINQIAIVPAPDYYIVGTMTDWVADGVKEELKLEKNEEAGEGVEEYMITLDFEAGAKFKVVKPEGEAYVWYPDGVDNDYVIENAGTYTVYFRPNGDGSSDWHYGVILVVANETDGINAVSAADQNAVIYNLSGQKVMKAQKGLYIVNGKKVLMK